MSYNYPTKLTTSGLVSDTQGKLDALIDMFDISSEPTNGHILVYNSTTKHFDAQAPSSGGGGSGFDGTSNLVVSNGVSLLTPDSTAGITFQTSGSTFGTGVDYIQVGNVEAAANILPAGSSQNFGDATHRFDAFFGDLNVNGTITGIDLADLGTKSINNLSDVDTTGVANGKILKYNSSTSKFEIADDSGTGGSTFTDTIQAQGALSMYCSDAGTNSTSTIAGVDLMLRSTTATFNSATGTMNTDGSDDNLSFKCNKILLLGSRDKAIMNQSVGDVLIRTQETESGSTEINIQHDENIVAVTGVLQLDTQSSDPTSNLANGQMYYNTSTNKFRGYANGAWVDLH